LPFDAEAELSVLAHLVDPLHDVDVLDYVDSTYFHDWRHARIVEQFRAGDEWSVEDAAYVENATRLAWPLTESLAEKFIDCASRRRRLLELEAERLELLGVA
jgi:hypothetical protein